MKSGKGWDLRQSAIYNKHRSTAYLQTQPTSGTIFIILLLKPISRVTEWDCKILFVPNFSHTFFTFSLRTGCTVWNWKSFFVIVAFERNPSWSFILVRHTEEEAMVIHTFSSFLMTTHTAAEIYSLEYLNEHFYRKLQTNEMPSSWHKAISSTRKNTSLHPI